MVNSSVGVRKRTGWWCAGWVIGLAVMLGFPVATSAPAQAGFFDDIFSVKKRNRYYKRERYRKRQYRRKYRKTRRQRVSRPRGPNPLLANAPDLNREEPVQVVVSLETQSMTVYKGGVELATSRISSGQPGYRTPAGVFSILQKKLRHYSNLYENAPMPYMQRLTWSGIALHGGKVPDYPASHGCVRMPHPFARNLYGLTDRGGHVVISTEDAQLEVMEHANLFQPGPLAAIFDPAHVAARAPARSVKAADGDEDERAEAPVFEGTNLRPVATRESKPKPVVTAHEERERFHGAELRSTAPIRVLITLRNEEEKIRDVQRLLRDLGFRPGAIDGVIGRDTIRAVKRFQQFKRLPVTGKVTPELIAILNGAAGNWDYPTGHLYIRQKMREIYHAPVSIKNADKPIGTHLYTAMHFKADAVKVRWTGVTLKHYVPDYEDDADTELVLPPDSGSAREALDRIEIPDHIRRKISSMLTTGSSLIITDKGAGRETQDGTDFLVITR